MLPTKFQVSWLYGSGEDAKNRFLRLRPRQSSWISDRNDFSYFLTYKLPRWPTVTPTSYPVSSQLTFCFRRRRKQQIFMTAAMAAILDFRSEIFYLFLIYKWLKCFLRWPSWLSDRNDLSFFFFFFYLLVTPMFPSRFRVNSPRVVRGVGF